MVEPPHWVNYRGRWYLAFNNKQDAEQALLRGNIKDGARILIHRSSFPNANEGDRYMYREGLALTTLLVVAAVIAFIVLAVIAALNFLMIQINKTPEARQEPLPNGCSLVTTPDGSAFEVCKDGEARELSGPTKNSNELSKSTENVGKIVAYTGLSAVGFLVVKTAGDVLRRRHDVQRATSPAPTPSASAPAPAPAKKRRRVPVPSLRGMKRMVVG